MNVLCGFAFIRDLRRLKQTGEYSTIHNLAFEEIPRWSNLRAHPQVKQLSAKDKAYRIRVGDYRIDLFFDGKTLTFARVLHRKEIYRYFP